MSIDSVKEGLLKFNCDLSFNSPCKKTRNKLVGRPNVTGIAAAALSPTTAFSPVTGTPRKNKLISKLTGSSPKKPRPSGLARMRRLDFSGTADSTKVASPDSQARTPTTAFAAAGAPALANRVNRALFNSPSTSSGDEDDFDLHSNPLFLNSPSSPACTQTPETQKEEFTVGDVNAVDMAAGTYEVAINGVIYPLKLKNSDADGKWHDVYDLTGDQVIGFKDEAGKEYHRHVSTMVFKCPRPVHSQGYKRSTQKASNLIHRDKKGYEHLKNVIVDGKNLVPRVHFFTGNGFMMDRMAVRAVHLMGTWAKGEDITKWNDALPEKRLLLAYKAFLGKAASVATEENRALASDAFLYNFMGSTDGSEWQLIDMEEPEDSDPNAEIFEYLLYAANGNKLVWDFLMPVSIGADLGQRLEDRKKGLNFTGAIPPSQHKDVGLKK